MRTARLFLPALLGVALFAGAAHAQPRPTKPPDTRSTLPEPARQAWDRATSLSKNNDHNGASVEYQRAYDLSHNPRVLFDLGVEEKSAGHYVRARQHWEQELTEGETVLTEAEKTELKADIQVVTKYITTFTVDVNEPGATVFIDDVAMSGATPFTSPIPIDPGEHTIRVQKDGFLPEIFKVVIKVGTPEAHSFVLKPDMEHRKAMVNVSVDGAPSATVFMDGKDMGPAPFHGEVTAEHHTFTAHADGFVDASKSIDAQYKETYEISLSLSAVRHQAKLIVDVYPAGASLLVDDKTVEGNHWEGTLDTHGGHTVTVKKQGYTPEVRDITLQDDEVRRLDIHLNEEKLGKTFIWWMVGTLAVVGGGAAASYFVFKQNSPGAYSGTYPPGLTQASRPFR
jgi:PEGA domain